MSAAKAWREGRYRAIEVCCATLARAFDGGTDAEGYGPLVGRAVDGSERWEFRSTIEAVPSVCPWCGANNEIREQP